MSYNKSTIKILNEFNFDYAFVFDNKKQVSSNNLNIKIRCNKFDMLNNKSILITGGTGTLGNALTKRILKEYPDVRRLVIFSRDEQKQYQMEKKFPESKYPALRYFIGDVRDEKRVHRAMKKIDFVIHTAAMKHVPIAEYNPMECIKTNILGAENIINASLENEVKSVVALSTDKAAAPINLYGATKLTSDKLFTTANNIRGRSDIKFSVVRYGNVMGSNGSVALFLKKKRWYNSGYRFSDDEI